jgi:uncharacterized protein
MPTSPLPNEPGPCPICHRVCSDTPDVSGYRPFCSRRCQQVDLVRWMDGKYAIVDEFADDDVEGDNSESHLL